MPATAEAATVELARSLVMASLAAAEDGVLRDEDRARASTSEKYTQFTIFSAAQVATVTFELRALPRPRGCVDRIERDCTHCSVVVGCLLTAALFLWLFTTGERDT